MTEIISKRCYKCNIEKTLESFGSNKSKKSGLSDECKECSREIGKLYYRANKVARLAYLKVYGQKNKEAIRNKQLQYRYGMSTEDWEAEFDLQGRKCKACGSITPRGGRWVVDHCHTTEKICGIICSKCNTACGHAGDDPVIAQACADYLALTRLETN